MDSEDRDNALARHMKEVEELIEQLSSRLSEIEQYVGYYDECRKPRTFF